MGKDRTLLGVAKKSGWASRLWPVGHGRFEQMCALAITGQLGGPQMCELDEHIAGCERCRRYLESVAQVSVQVMPLLAEKHAPDRKLTPPAGMGERFLARLTAETLAATNSNGAKVRPFALPAPAAYSSADRRATVHSTVEEKRQDSSFGSLWRPLAVAAGCLAVVVAAYYAGTRRSIQPPPQMTQVPAAPSAMSPATAKPGEPDRVGELERQKSALESKLVAMKQELTTAQTERESLNQELAAAKEKLAALTAQTANRTVPDSTVAAHQTNEQVLALQADVSRLSQRLAESEIKMGMQKQANDDLNSKLELTATDLQRERDLKSAMSEMGKLVGARNLHIVDVYDADPSGKRQRAFGRVFYIENAAVVMYAYDLDAPGEFKQSVVFHVWGGKAGVKEVTHSLGILHKDDAGQNRWAMTFDDPNVLAQINSVFVTAESASKHYDQPHGKKVLYAYFGGPANHPDGLFPTPTK